MNFLIVDTIVVLDTYISLCSLTSWTQTQEQSEVAPVLSTAYTAVAKIISTGLTSCGMILIGVCVIL